MTATTLPAVALLWDTLFPLLLFVYVSLFDPVWTQQAIQVCISATTQLKFPGDTGTAQDARQDGNSAINIK